MDYLYATRDGHRFLPTRGTGGPWDATIQHGGGPASLIAFLAEQKLADGFDIARLTVDLLRPVPIAPLDAQVVRVREGRNICVLDVELRTADKLVVKASVLAICRMDLGDGLQACTPHFDVPGPEQGEEADEAVANSSGFIKGVELRSIRGRFGDARAGVCWFRQKRRIVEGMPSSSVVRAAGLADFCNAIASEIDYTQYTFLNADLGIEFVRPPVGEWVLLEGEAWRGTQGRALSTVRLADETGYFGLARQNLVVRPL